MRAPPPHIKVRPYLSAIAWRVEWVLSRLRGREAKLTRETASSAHSFHKYSVEKIERMLDFRFRNVGVSVGETAECYLGMPPIKDDPKNRKPN